MPYVRCMIKSWSGCVSSRVCLLSFSDWLPYFTIFGYDFLEACQAIFGGVLCLPLRPYLVILCLSVRPYSVLIFFRPYLAMLCITRSDLIWLWSDYHISGAWSSRASCLIVAGLVIYRACCIVTALHMRQPCTGHASLRRLYTCVNHASVMRPSRDIHAVISHQLSDVLLLLVA